jgi:hypothetical protein
MANPLAWPAYPTGSSVDELCCYAFSPSYHLDLPGARRYNTLLIIRSELSPSPSPSPSSPCRPLVVPFPSFTAQVAFSQTLPQPLGHVHATHQPSKHKPHLAQISYCHCHPTAAARPQNAIAKHYRSPFLSFPERMTGILRCPHTSLSPPRRNG